MFKEKALHTSGLRGFFVSGQCFRKHNLFGNYIRIAITNAYFRRFHKTDIIPS